jgi:hypothetical protein
VVGARAYADVKFLALGIEAERAGVVAFVEALQ